MDKAKQILEEALSYKNCEGLIEENSRLEDAILYAITEALQQGAVSGSDMVKSDWNLRECFKQLRFDKNHHLGLGDIRLTIAQQEGICDLVERYYQCR